MTDTRDSIMWQQGSLNLDAMTREVWRHIAARNTPARLFLWDKGPARLEHYTATMNGDPLPMFERLNFGRMTFETAQAVRFLKVNPSKGEGLPAFLEIAPPRRLIENLIATPPEDIPLPRVFRIARAPIFSPQGELQTEPGYHASTGVYLLWKSSDAPITEIQSNPTDEEIAVARDLLLEPLQDFPFRSAQDKAHAVAFAILPFVRECINGPTPLHLFNKPMAGTGATLLINTLLTPSVGRQHGKLVEQTTDEEWSKVITSLLSTGPSVTVIDNARRLVSPVLAAAITSDTWDGRRLGKSEMLNLPVRTAWAATGNNVILHSEIQRRVVTIQLDSGLEDPSVNRVFKIEDLNTWLDLHRIDLMHAILTIVQAWFARGCPQGKRRLGMFEGWSSVIGGILDVAGIPGFLERAIQADKDGDLERDAHRWLVEEWWRRHGAAPVYSRDLSKWAMEPSSPFSEYLTTARDKPLQANDRAAAFGVHLRQVKDRVYTFQDEHGTTFSLTIVRDKVVHGTARWRLEKSAGVVKLRSVSLNVDDATAVEDGMPSTDRREAA